jgi:hypothetical protein
MLGSYPAEGCDATVRAVRCLEFRRSFIPRRCPACAFTTRKPSTAKKRSMP